MRTSDHRLIIVTPVYEDAAACARLLSELADQFDEGVYVVVVDDGSVRQPPDIADMEQAGLDGVILKLRRNVGHQRAIAIGLGFVSERIQPGHRVVVMDSDGEDRPSTIPVLLGELESDDVDVVVAERKSRIETLRFKAFYAAYKLIFGLLTGKTISFGNFMALRARAVKRLVAMQELSIHVAGTVIASKLRTVAHPLDRGARYEGRSNMTFVGLVLHGFKALMVFAEDVLVRVGITCALIAVLSVIGAFAAVLLKLIGFSTPGWFSIALGILVLMFLQTGALALMTLMLTGVVRGGTTNTTIAYQDFVERVIETGQRPASA